jgi:hypothetical protein
VSKRTLPDRPGELWYLPEQDLLTEVSYVARDTSRAAVCLVVGPGKVIHFALRDRPSVFERWRTDAVYLGWL